MRELLSVDASADNMGVLRWLLPCGGAIVFVVMMLPMPWAKRRRVAAESTQVGHNYFGP